MMPMPMRRLTSIGVRLEGQIYLFDCGEGTQVPYKESPLGMRKLDVIALTHIHADHVLGLPGMLMLRAQMEDPGPLVILGTAGIDRFIKNIRADLRMFINYPIEVREWHPNADSVAYEDEYARILWFPLEHTVSCIGYRIEEHQRAGRFDIEAAKKLGVPQGPLWGKLQKGESVQIPDGREIHPDDVLGQTRRGRHLAYATDTRVTPKLQPLLTDADIAFVESMFAEGMEEDAEKKRHMTVVQSTQAAREAGVKQLVLVHISPRYDRSQVRDLSKVAKNHHPNVCVGKDGQIFRINLPE